ncbi:hypothetical protein [Stenotrophomonas maltophilia]|uniref:hypothetical protein n=1 Tax=Stenotrophomonas maltophilia TaxID=40324 RepID=UPI003875F169
MHLFRPELVFLLALPLVACGQPETQRKPPRLLTNEQGCSITIDNQPINPYQDPSPIERACVGPYQLELPQNYYGSQMGPEHDGSFGLALEYPSLQPFKPGERMNLSADVSVRTVAIRYSYVDRITVQQALRSAYTPSPGRRDNPAESLEGRIKGEPVHGLVPYYMDMEKVRNYHRAKGLAETAPVMRLESHHDWYVSHDASGAIDQFIKCTPREITESGVEYRDGKMVKNDVRGVARCTQEFIIEGLSTIVDLSYPREGLASWRQMEARARALLLDNIRKEKGK